MEEDLTLKEGIHPIFCAISLDNMNTFKELTKIYPQFQDLKIKISFPYNTCINIEPFQFAAVKGRVKIVEYFIDMAAPGQENPKYKRGSTPLHCAAEKGHLQVVKILLDNIENEKNPKNTNGFTPLAYAAKEGHLGVVKLLLDNIISE